MNFLRTVLASLCWLVLSGPAALAQSAPVSEYALKSALLFKLPQFVYRPEADRSAPLTICLLGNNPFGGTLEKLAQTPVDGRTARFQRIDGASAAAGCDFVFISRSEASGIDAILRRLAAHPVVTVSDIEGFAQAGGMVELARGGEGASISILINRRAAQRQSIEFNAQLLRLAKLVEP